MSGWVGAVLTGGASRRMGRDKATLEVEGVPMAERVATALRTAGADDVVCVGPPVGALASIAEDEPGQGPLGAIVAAIRWAGGRPVAVVACDLVTPAPGVFAAIVEALVEGCDAAVPVANGRLQPLTAAYAPSALGPLAAAYGRGERSISAALGSLVVAELTDVDPAGLQDADEPGDLPR